MHMISRHFNICVLSAFSTYSLMKDIVERDLLQEK